MLGKYLHHLHGTFNVRSAKLVPILKLVYLVKIKITIDKIQYDTSEFDKVQLFTAKYSATNEADCTIKIGATQVST